jgi:hypothetical protein
MSPSKSSGVVFQLLGLELHVSFLIDTYAPCCREDTLEPSAKRARGEASTPRSARAMRLKKPPARMRIPQQQVTFLLLFVLPF